jgi:hypothetical protein
MELRFPTGLPKVHLQEQYTKQCAYEDKSHLVPRDNISHPGPFVNVVYQWAYPLPPPLSPKLDEVLVILPALRRAGKHLVGLLDYLKGLLATGVGILVRMDLRTHKSIETKTEQQESANSTDLKDKGPEPILD